MGGKIIGSVGDLIASLMQQKGRSVRNVNDQMQIEMLAVQQEAIKRAPVDHGNLEAAIKIENLGQRRAWAVFVDGSMPDDTGKYTVGDYADWLHEAVYNLGPKSQAKNVTGNVGRKYLENPFKEAVIRGMIGRLQQVLDGSIR